jgi:hypothetical protein
MKNNLFLIILPPLVVCLFSEIFFFRPNLFYAAIVLSALVIFFTVKSLIKEKIASLRLWNLSWLPLFFVLSADAYSLILLEKSFIQILFAAQFLFLFYYFKNLAGDKKEVFLENVSAWGNFLSLFLFFSFLFGLKSLLDYSILFLAGGFLIVSFLSVSEIFWANKIMQKQEPAYIFIICLILTQAGWCFCFLPLDYNILGLLLAIGHYILIGLIKPFLREGLNSRAIKFYLIGGIMVMAILLATAKWI